MQGHAEFYCVAILVCCVVQLLLHEPLDDNAAFRLLVATGTLVSQDVFIYIHMHTCMHIHTHACTHARTHFGLWESVREFSSMISRIHCLMPRDLQNVQKIPLSSTASCYSCSLLLLL